MSARCAKCDREVPLAEFPRRQKARLKLGQPAQCNSCSPGKRKAEDEERKKREEVAEFFYRESRGQVDGSNRRTKGGNVSLAAARPCASDLEEAADILAQFKQAYDVRTLSYDACLTAERTLLHSELAKHDHGSIDHLRISGMLHDLEASHKRVESMQWLELEEAYALSGTCLTDFMTTVRGGEHGTRYAFESETVTSMTDEYAFGELNDAPFMTQVKQLKYCCSHAGLKLHATHVDPKTIVRHAAGTVLWAPGRVLVGMRLPVTLLAAVCFEFRSVHYEWRKRRPFLRRGKSCANVSVSFAVTGIKGDQNSSLAMPHTSNSQHAYQAMCVFRRMLALYRDHIHPIVMEYIPVLLAPVHRLLQQHDVQLYVMQVTAVTAGELFWPLSHVDDDFSFTVLVCIDMGRGPVAGGDFSFAAMGHVLKMEHGDILIYNPRHYHSTTEFKLDGPDDSRVFFAFFMSASTLASAIKSSVVYRRRGASSKIFY